MNENKKISVIIKLFADLTQYGPAKAEIVLPKGSSLNKIFDKYIHLFFIFIELPI